MEPPPPDLTFVPDHSARWSAPARTLVGGDPVRLYRFSPRGAEAVSLLVGGSSLGEARRRTGADLSRIVARLVGGGVLHPLPGPGPWGPGDVTVVVAVRDRAGALAALLDRLTPDVDGGRPAPALVVVDDGSTDGSGDVARRAGARVLRRDQPGGPAAARNLGWVEAATPIVAFIDSDCLPTDGWLERLLPHLADPGVAAVAPRITGGTTGPASPNTVERYESVASPLDRGPRPAGVRPGTRVAYVPAAALVVRRAALEAAGGFEEALHTGEDVDLMWRLADAGWSVRYEPSVTIAHQGRSRFAAMAARRFAYGTSAAPLSRRHPGRLAPVRVPAWSLAAWASLTLRRAPWSARLATSAGILAAATAVWTARLTPTPSTGFRRFWLPGPESQERRMVLALTARLVARHHVRTLRSLGDGLLRPYAPLTVLTLMTCRRVRPVLAAASAARLAARWWPRRATIGPVTFARLGVGDDFAYSLGVWWGCAVHRTVEPLIPHVSSGLPGRRRKP